MTNERREPADGFALADIDLDQLVTTTEAAAFVGVSAETIYTWVKRGHLTAADANGRTRLYRLIDVLRASRATSQRAAGRNRLR